MSIGISIHTSREGCDTGTVDAAASCTGFQSTHPVRDVTGHRRERPQKN